MAKKFFKCAKCGNIIAKYVDAGVPVACCGEPMVELVPNTTDAAGEKHVPVVEVNGGHERILSHPDEPKAEFVLADGEVALRAYEFCNLHGLWSVEVK